MSELELKKKKFELARVRLGREELELKILEREDEINKLKDAIKIQLEKELELERIING